MTDPNLPSDSTQERETSAAEWVDRPVPVEQVRLVDFRYGDNKFSGVTKNERTFADGTKAYELEYSPGYIERHGADNLPRFVHESALFDPSDIERLRTPKDGELEVLQERRARLAAAMRGEE